MITSYSIPPAPDHAARVSPPARQFRYNGLVRTVTVAKFDSFEEADRADKAYYLSLTPEQRLRLLGELCSRLQGTHHDPPPRLARVYRIVELPRR